MYGFRVTELHTIKQNNMNKEIIQQAEISFIAVGFTTPSISYSNANKIATAKFNLIADDGQEYDYPQVTLWEGDAYDAIGQFTDIDVTNRLIEIFS